MTINTDNLVDDFVYNLVSIFENNWERLSIKESYKDDVWMVPIVPSIAVSCSSFYSNLRAISSANVRYEYDLIGTVWYYHSTLNIDVATNLVMRNAYMIADHIIKHASLNGFLTNTRAIVRSCAYAPRRRSGVILSAARIVVTAPYQTRIPTID